MAIRLNPYLNFRDNAREAMTFYHSILGGDITFSTFGEFNATEDPSEQDKIMHSMNHMGFNGHAGFGVTINGDEEERLAGYFEKLSEGGEVVMPFGPAPWGGVFGMCDDRYGISWLINCQEEEPV